MKGNRAKGTGKRKLPAEWSENVDESKPPEDAQKIIGNVENPNQPETPQEPGPVVENNTNEVQEPPGIRANLAVFTTYKH